ncbi:hypothetical protein [uncultured Ilyobacter sp.]|nr:hypothetical protein [uncultured Ilyobacter sp.]
MAEKEQEQESIVQININELDDLPGENMRSINESVDPSSFFIPEKNSEE